MLYDFLKSITKNINLHNLNLGYIHIYCLEKNNIHNNIGNFYNNINKIRRKND